MKKIRKIVFLLIGVLVFISSSRQAYAEHKNESNSQINLSQQKNNVEKDVDKIVNKYINKDLIPSVSIYASKNGKVILDKAYGYAQIYGGSDFDVLDNPLAYRLKKPLKAKKNTLYDLASVTKVVSTTQAIMKLNYEKKINIYDKVSKYLPGFENNGKENVTIEQLLTHTSGLPQWRPSFLYVNNDRGEELKYIKNLPLEFTPGTYKYSDFGFMTLGYIVESVSGMRLDKYVENEIYKTLDMKNTMYNPLRKGINKKHIAATSWGNPFEYRMVDEKNYPGFGYDCSEDSEAFSEFSNWRNYVLIGEVNDGNAAMANDGVAGHAGVFSTAEDLGRLGEVMLNGGIYKNKRIYDDKIIDLFTKNHLGENNRGYGFELGMSYMGEKASSKTFGHNGFTGTHFIVDPENSLVIVVLTNKQNLGLDENTGSYPSTFDFVREVSTSIQNRVLSR